MVKCYTPCCTILLLSLAGWTAQAASNSTSPSQVAALLGFKSRLTGSLGPLSTWVEGTDPCGAAECGPSRPPCAWAGVACLGWQVVGLRLSVRNTGQSLSGTLGDDLSALPQLAMLDLSGNKLSGGLPSSFGNLEQLQVLDLSANKFDGGLPPQWGQMTMLEVLYLAANNLYGTLPYEWAGMAMLRTLDIRDNCGVCGGLPDFPKRRSPDFVVLARDTSLGWACASSNCSSFPLGFVGQAAIIITVVVLMTSCCCWRRCHMFRHHAPLEEERRGLGLIRSVFSLRRAPRPVDPEEQEQGRGSSSTGPPRKVEPPIVVVMPDGSSLCTARLDPEAPSRLGDPQAAALAASGGVAPKSEGSAAGQAAQQGVGAHSGAQQGQQAGGSWTRWIPWCGSRREGGASRGGGGEGAANAPSAAAQQQQQGQQEAGGGWVEIYSRPPDTMVTSAARMGPHGGSTTLLHPSQGPRTSGGSSGGGGGSSSRTPAEVGAGSLEGAWGLGGSHESGPAPALAPSTWNRRVSSVQWAGTGPAVPGAATRGGRASSAGGADGFLLWGNTGLPVSSGPSTSMTSGGGRSVDGSAGQHNTAQQSAARHSRSRRHSAREVPVFDLDLSDFMRSASEGQGVGSHNDAGRASGTGVASK